MDETADDKLKHESQMDSVIEEGEQVFDFFGKSHMLRLAALFAKSESAWRFNEIRDETDLSQTTLSTRLTELVEEDLIVRRSYDEIPPRVEYEATERLRDVGPILMDLLEWWREVD